MYKIALLSPFWASIVFAPMDVPLRSSCLQAQIFFEIATAHNNQLKRRKNPTSAAELDSVQYPQAS
jgi:hypothetical protein